MITPSLKEKNQTTRETLGEILLTLEATAEIMQNKKPNEPANRFIISKLIDCFNKCIEASEPYYHTEKEIEAEGASFYGNIIQLNPKTLKPYVTEIMNIKDKKEEYLYFCSPFDNKAVNTTLLKDLTLSKRQHFIRGIKNNIETLRIKALRCLESGLSKFSSRPEPALIPVVVETREFANKQ